MADATSALGTAPPIGGTGLAIAELPHQAKVTVRGRDAVPALVQAVTAALGVAPPLAANTTTRLAARTVLWLGPGEWRVVGPPGDEAALVEALRSEVPRRLAGVVDVSDFYTTIRLGGVAARAVLAQGCPLDLHPRVFHAGRCAQSLLAKTDVLLHQTDDAPTYDIQVRWSQAAYLWAWLATAAGNLA
ncbi:MAG: sarcosine oxidase subunit gamma [Proteobacteria bacterium]|nr:sarcosine oxidase subunit gamma [Pseudomonadota bacterium]